METTSALALSIVLVGLAAILRMSTGTWLHPGSFFALFWCFAGILPLLFAPHDPVGPNAILLLIVASLAVASGAVVGNGGLRTRRLDRPSPAGRTELTTLSAIVVLSIVLGVGSSIGFLRGNDVLLSDVFDIQKLVVVSNRAYFARYAEAGPPPQPILSQALLPFVFLAPTIGGMLFELRNERIWKTIAVGSLFPAVIVTVLQTTKGATFYALCLWTATYFAARLRHGKLAVFTRGHLFIAGGFAVILIGFFFVVQLMRLAVLDASLFDVVAMKLIGAAFGHMTALSGWLNEYWTQPFAPTLGKYTFAGPLELLGYSKRIPGIYDTLVYLVSGDNTNVYTAFRPLIEDYTMVGALVVLTLVGLIGGVGFRLVAMGRWSAVPLLVIAYTTTLWTPVTWIWLYNSLTAAIVAVGTLLFLIRLVRGAPHARLDETEVASTHLPSMS